MGSVILFQNSICFFQYISAAGLKKNREKYQTDKRDKILHKAVTITCRGTVNQSPHQVCIQNR